MPTGCSNPTIETDKKINHDLKDIFKEDGKVMCTENVLVKQNKMSEYSLLSFI